MSWRFACAVIPEFAISVRGRSLSEEERLGPIALVDDAENARVKEINQAAIRAGVNIGQTASRARARCPDLRCLRWDERLISDATSRLAEVLTEVSPGVEPIPGLLGGYWLDARGMRWQGGELGLSRSAIQRASQYGYSGLRVGIADSLLVAQAAAFRTCLSQPIRVVSKGADAEFLKGLSLDELPIDPMIRRVLRALGVESVRELLKLPAPTLTTRFGHLGQQALLFAQGEDHRRVESPSTSASPESVLVLEEPVSEVGTLIFGLHGIAVELSRALSAESMSASCLAIIFALDDGSEVIETLSPARPTQNSEAIFELVRERLERRGDEMLSSPVVEVRLRVIEMVPAVAQQVHVGSDRWDANALERALDRLQGRFGQTVVFEATQRNELQRERLGHWTPVLEVPLEPPQVGSSTHSFDEASPVRRCIRNPPQIHVRADSSGYPLQIRWRGEWRQIHAWGPERVSGKWWGSDQYAYEDYRAALRSHEVLWIRRDALNGDWSLQGWFD